MQRNASAVSILIIFLAGGFYLEKSSRFTPLKQAMQGQSVPTSMLNIGPLGKILKQLTVVQCIPNDYSQFKANNVNSADLSTNIFRRKRYVGEYLYKASTGGPKDFPSSLVVKGKDLKRGLPVISVVVDEQDLYGPEKGIISNSKNKGREWERLAYVSYYEDGNLLFATNAGIRQHGGISRIWNQLRNCRLYFRNDYGTNQFRPGILFSPETEPVKTLIVRRYALLNCLAFDIIRQIGAFTPSYKPALFFLNGEYKGIKVLTEHLKRRQWRSHFGHDNFYFYRYRANNDKESTANYQKIVRWVRDPKVKMTMELAGNFIDIDNFSRHLFSFVLCARARDWYQGAAVLDSSKPGAKWFWVNWDMDRSFILKNESWDIILNSVDPEGYQLHRIRSILFKRLLSECPNYRKYYVRLVMDLLNHRVNEKFLIERSNYYVRMAKNLKLSRDELSNARGMSEFLDNRPNFLRMQMSRFFETGESLSCEVNGPPGIRFKIDGYSETNNYKGWYFEGAPIKIEIVSPHRDLFSHWLVNGKKISGSQLVYNIDSITSIEPVLKKN